MENNMRKIKFLVASLLFCAMSYAGYMGYERVTMSEAERFMQANVEALTSGEGGGGSQYMCYDEYKEYVNHGTPTRVRTCDICDHHLVYKPRTKSICPRIR